MLVGFEFGNDLSVDPELALALRMNMEEEQTRVIKQNKERAQEDAEAEKTLPEIKEEDEVPQPPLNIEVEVGGSRDPCS
jgi:desulfoferrodoxin (superoxide reductase-like protein)